MKRLTAAFGLLFCCLPAVAHALLGTGPGGVPTHGMITAPAADASLNPRGTWAANTVYAVGDSFLYNGTSYVVATAFTSGSTFDATNLIQGVATNSAIAASNALTQAQAAYQNAPHFAVVNYGNAQTCTWTISHPDATTGVVTYTGGVDDHAAMQAAFNAAAAPGAPQTLPGGTGPGASYYNLAQSAVVFPDGKVCRDMTGTITAEPGIGVIGNGATIIFDTTGNGLDMVYTVKANGSGGFGRFNDYVENLNIVGPGVASSLGKGLHAQLVNRGVVYHVNVSGFKYGISANQMQYTYVLHSRFAGNQVGCYVANDPSNVQTLPSIDNTFEATDCNGNTRFGLWQQDGVGNRYQDGDYGFNGSTDILVGGQMQSYVNAVTVSGGVCPANANVQFTFADSTGGQLSLGKGFLVTNSSGAPTAATTQITNGGMNISNAVFTAPSCTTAPTFTPSYVNDQTATGVAALGDYQGSSYGDSFLTFTNIKAESSIKAAYGQMKPDSGFIVILGTPGAENEPSNIVFNEPDFAIDAASAYAHVLRVYGTGVRVVNPFHANGSDPGMASGSANVGDHCDYQVVINGPALSVDYLYGGPVNESNAGLQGCGGNLTGLGPANYTYTAWSTAGALIVPGLTAQTLNSTDTGNPPNEGQNCYSGAGLHIFDTITPANGSAAASAALSGWVCNQAPGVAGVWHKVW